MSAKCHKRTSTVSHETPLGLDLRVLSASLARPLIAVVINHSVSPVALLLWEILSAYPQGPAYIHAPAPP
jgi:hypothetical protein